MLMAEGFFAARSQPGCPARGVFELLVYLWFVLPPVLIAPVCQAVELLLYRALWSCLCFFRGVTPQRRTTCLWCDDF